MESPEKIEPGESVGISYKVQNDLGETLKDFEVVHEKIMHFILVRKDLQHFQHLHPSYDESTGEFTIDITFPEAGPYRLFPDFTPGADNPQQLPVTLSYDLEVGDMSTYDSNELTVNTEPVDYSDEYEVAYNFNQLNVKAQKPVKYILSIQRTSQIVENLEPYLGAMGHSVILREDTLDFIHAHAESTESTVGSISFETTFPEPGKYKIFSQFQHEGIVMTSEYVIEVRAADQTNGTDSSMDEEAVSGEHSTGH